MREKDLSPGTLAPGPLLIGIDVRQVGVEVGEDSTRADVRSCD